MTIRAGGIKVSSPLAQFDLVRGNSSPPDHGLTSLLAGLADERINLTFLTRAGPTAPTVASLCVAETDRARTEEVVRALPDIASRLSMTAPVVAVSVYPHGANAGLLGALLRTLAIKNVPLLGLATSLSALTVTVGANRLASALAALDDILELPPNHAPLRWEPTENDSLDKTPRMETAAVYWEPIIRTYGFEVRQGLTMARLILHPGSIDSLDLLPQPQDADGCGLIMAAAQTSSDATLALWVIVDGVVAQRLRDRADASNGPEITYPVEVVSFHGPHYGDRYGIASATHAALERDEVTVLLAGFTGASVFLAVGPNEGQRAVQSLRSAFTTPGGTASDRESQK